MQVGAGPEAPLTCPLRSPPARQVLTSTTRKPAASTWRRASTKRPSRSLLRLVKLGNSHRRKASLGGGRGGAGLTASVLGGPGRATPRAGEGLGARPTSWPWAAVAAAGHPRAGPDEGPRSPSGAGTGLRRPAAPPRLGRGDRRDGRRSRGRAGQAQLGGGQGGSPRTQPYCVATEKRPRSAAPSSPFRVPCSSFCRGVTFLSGPGGPGSKAEAGSRGPIYSGCSSRAVALMCSSF